MDDLLLARLQMAMSLAFHIVFAAIGIAVPVLMVLAEWRWLRTGDEVFLQLAKRWAKGTAVFFAIGAVSGTVLSFELGLLWPRVMEEAGGIIGVPFGLEGFAFFTEAIFLGIYLYGWERVGRVPHLLAGVVVAISGAASAMFVIMVNGWMNAPRGFRIDEATGAFVDVDPVAAALNPAWAAQTVHMLLAAYAATGFAAAGLHALQLLRGRSSRFHRAGLALAMTMAAPAALLVPVAGDWAAKVVAETQPVKLAAMEGQFETRTHAPMRIGGWPDEDARETRFALEIPGLLSLLAYGDPAAEVTGLNDVPRDEWPPVAITHLAFQGMVAIGVVMALVAVAWLVMQWRGRAPRWLWRAIVACAPLGFVAIELGWTVTEVGRQPWVIHGILRTEDAVTPMPGLVGPFVTFGLVYLGLAAVVALIVVQQIRQTDRPRSAGA